MVKRAVRTGKKLYILSCSLHLEVSLLCLRASNKQRHVAVQPEGQCANLRRQFSLAHCWSVPCFQTVNPLAHPTFHKYSRLLKPVFSPYRATEGNTNGRVSVKSRFFAEFGLFRTTDSWEYGTNSFKLESVFVTRSEKKTGFSLLARHRATGGLWGLRMWTRKSVHHHHHHHHNHVHWRTRASLKDFKTSMACHIMWIT